MKIIVKWTQSNQVPIVALSVDPVHNQLIVGIGKTIVFFDALTGKELNRCEKHTQDITCLSFRKDGKFFASGAKDNIVYFWDVSNLARPINKITFQDPILRMGYNPCLMYLLSMSKTTLSICRDNSANKYPLDNTGVDFCWTNDGMKYAIAFENGSIAIRDKDSDKDEKVIMVNEDKIERITCICFSNSRFLNKEYVLYVCTWDKNFHLLDLFNAQVVETKKLTADPISITLFKDDYVLVGTNNREINFFSKEGIFIQTITEGINSWVTCVRQFDKYSSIISCSNDGSIISHQITFQIVHGIYNDRYVYRKNLREIVIHDLISGTKSNIVTKRYIRKLAVFKDLVAALTNDKVLVHQISDDDNTKPKYFIKWEGPLSLMLLASNHLLICKENHVYLYPLSNDVALITNVERDWSFETDVKYLRVLGGGQKREGVLCGLRSGEVFIIYIDNQFPVLIYTHEIPIRSLDINYTRKKLAVIDDNFDLTMVDLVNKSVMWKGEKAKSIAFNSDIDNMISFWYEGNVFIKTSDFDPICEKMTGVIIGFRGTKVFMLQSYNNVSVLDISNSQSIMKYAERKEMNESYKIACLGATNQEWIYLGFESLLNFDFAIAANCFKKIQDIRLINLVLDLEQEKKNGVNEDIIRGDIYSHIGKYKEAANLYIKGGAPGKAQEMYATLKMYAEALEIKAKYLQGGDNEFTDEILHQQAEWLAENKKFKEAGDLYMAIGKKKKAIEIYGEHNLLDSLIEVCRNLTKDDNAELISLCGHYFKKNHNYGYAAEAYLKLGDQKALVYMNVELKKWDEAFILSRENKQLSEYVHLQYAEQLILEDKFKEAQESYRKADRVDLSMKLLNKLIDNAVYEKRYKDACFLFLSLSNDALAMIKEFKSDVMNMTKGEVAKIKDFKDSNDLADIFNAYDYIYKYIEEPFSSDVISLSPDALFNACRFLVNKISNFKSHNVQYRSILPSYVYYCIGILAKKFDCFKTARFSFERLANLNYPLSWTEKIDLEIMNIRTKAYVDKENHMPMCYNCLHSNPLINQQGDQCSVCCAPFIRCALSFENLPLVEFRPSKGITDDQAIDFIKLSSVEKLKRNLVTKNTSQAGVHSLKIDMGDSNEDLFEAKMAEMYDNQQSTENYVMLTLDESVLKTLNENEIYIIDNRTICKNAPVRFFKKRKKDTAITMCKFCYRFFKLEEFENAFIKAGKCCPLCKNVDDTMKTSI